MEGIISRDHATAPQQEHLAGQELRSGPGRTDDSIDDSGTGKEEAVHQAQDLSEKSRSGAAVYEFDPDATPEQKKALALKGAADKLAPIRGIREKHQGGQVVASDLGGYDVQPTITISDIQASSGAVVQNGKSDDSQKSSLTPETGGAPAGETNSIPGGLSTEIASAIPEWYKVGWRGQNKTLLETGDFESARMNSLLAEFLSESYFGAWYHNAAIIFFAVFATYYSTRFGFGLSGLVIILSLCSTYYQASITRVRMRARDDMSRELSRKRLFTDHETVDWMNNFLSRFWLIYEPVLSATIVASVDQVLSVSAPAGIDSMRMTTFTLGTKAPRIEFIRTHPGTEEDVIVMDWRLSFIPNDVSDMTARQASTKVNPKVVLNLKIGKGKLMLSKDLVTEDITFAGLMRIRLKLMNNFPHVQVVDLSFLEKPVIDFVAKPIGFDLDIIPGLEGFIHNQLHAILGPMMYDPNVFTINLEQLLASAPIDTAIGVLAITVHNARGLKGVKLGGGLPDPYVILSLGARSGLGKTPIKHSTVNPHWNDTKFLLVNSLNESLNMTVMDYNDRRKDSELGAAVFDMKSLQEDPEQEELNTDVLLAGKARGSVKYTVKFFPVLTPKKLADGTEETLPESKTGIARITLHQGKDLDNRRSGGSMCNPYARIYLRGQAIHKTATFKRNHSPVWESHTEFLVTNKKEAVIGIKVIDDKGFGSDPTIGYVNVKLTDILKANEQKQDWFPLKGSGSDGTGKIRMSASFRPVAMAGAINSANDFRPPIGVVRIWFKRAVDLKNVEALTGGKSDPYMRVVRNGLVVSRTLVFNNNLEPVFDEIVYAPVHSISEYLVLEAMDYQHNSKDRTLGQCRLDMKDLVGEGSDKKEEPFVSLGAISRTEALQQDGGRAKKGSVIFEAKFYPTIPIRGVAFAPAANPLDRVKSVDKEDDDGASIIEPDADDGATIEGEDDMSRAMHADADGQVKATAYSNGHEGSETADVQNGQGEAAAQGDAAFTPGHRKALLSNVSAMTTATNATAETADGITMSREEIMQYQSGVLVLNIVSGKLAKKGGRVEVLLDDGYWPAYSTEVARSTNCNWDEVGEAFIRELSYSRIILKLNESDRDSQEDIQCEFRCQLSEFLESCLDRPADFTLTDSAGGNRSVVTVSAKYVPVPITLEMRETVNNTGLLRVELLEGHNLKSADRNGKSDPYCVFRVAGEKVFKSNVQKKTLNPKWNQTFEVLIPSRVAAAFTVDVEDWDRVGGSDHLGVGHIELADIEPFEATTRTIALRDDKGGNSDSTITIKMVFRPEFVARSRAATSTFVGGMAGGAASGVGGVVGGGAHLVGKGGKVVAGGVGGVGKGVFHGVSRLVPGRRSNTLTTLESNDGLPAESEEGFSMAVPELPAGAAPAQTVARSDPAAAVRAPGVNGQISTVAPVSGAPDFGTLQITVVDIENNEDGKHYVSIRHGGKSVDKVNASRHDAFTVKTLPEALILTVILRKKVFGPDKALGEESLDVWKLVSPGGPTSTETSIQIGETKVQLALQWSANAGSAPTSVRRDSIVSNAPTASQAPDSPHSTKSRSRFSMVRNR